ncbi:SDR family NAD(P)-dependent oxidoreductase [Nocardia farcinica]|uniref:3-oxoacyl-[acyl-carrier-protein] reductase MabA n=2 Tax=Nocardia farcinica TaxID=37329 RepID=Q5YUC2_NOCFA|nr:SDR family NAD(P)-dependent oxidoreductase [Nocardia farcinica]AXK89223.1 SDR family NAD(P)-dependent oxidoreductase [Nocardia farcinica]MBF6188984.1 SDR family NAD(P)-dependent oxidoreductase [Nocardia farcinica]MBF6309423.1 SDR family NAD(P)-dependent oxidoreductase [Nocardia farcinica]MBF6387740.1 SDR family NAD(P)-dependent oxidoreductase [Nocardia farcinica]MBF6410738.1 SDR family NAD(P)-dependent oxidoreductase [Nocardia farcinica]
MTQRLRGRKALVTGSSRGIGRAIAQRLAAEGAVVAVTARSLHPSPSIRDGETHVLSGSLAETVQLIEAAGGRAVAIPADLEDAEQRATLVDRVAEELDGLDILVNNAGFADYSVIEKMSDETFHRTLRHYLEVPFVLSRAAIPHLRKQGAGWIVNIGSSTGLSPIRPFREYNKTSGDVVYASAKAALHRFTQGLAAELLDEGIAVNAVGPSTAILTPGAATLLPEGYETEPVEYLAQTVLEMCTAPAADRTGLVAFSLHYPYATGTPVLSLDGRTELPRREPPAWANPNILPEGV